MLGTLIKPVSEVELKYQKSCELTSLLRKMSRFSRHNLGISYELKYHHQDRVALKRCVELAKDFRKCDDERMEECSLRLQP
jgi:hypothetical protein